MTSITKIKKQVIILSIKFTIDYRIKMEAKENKIMNTKNIHDTIKRISYQIYENNFKEKDLVLAGVKENGLILAKRIKRIGNN